LGNDEPATSTTGDNFRLAIAWQPALAEGVLRRDRTCNRCKRHARTIPKGAWRNSPGRWHTTCDTQKGLFHTRSAAVIWEGPESHRDSPLAWKGASHGPPAGGVTSETVLGFLKDIQFPAKKDDLIHADRRNGAPDDMSAPWVNFQSKW